MNFVPISDNAARQSIDAINIWTEYQNAKAAAQHFAGGMYWKKEGAYEYLVKTLAGNKQHRMGPRTEATERVFASFFARKIAAKNRLSSLAEALDEAQRQNKAVRAGRVPDIVVKVLNAIADAGLERHYRVVGTHALYAYESFAGGRISTGAGAANYTDPLWDAKHRVELLVDLQRAGCAVMAVMKKVDQSFQRREDGGLTNESVINNKGFEVVFLRTAAGAGEQHPAHSSDCSADPCRLQAQVVAALAKSPLFSQPIISATGKIAKMNTVDPQTFVNLKRWMSSLNSREAILRSIDALQADIVQEMLQTKMLASGLD